MKKIQQLDGIRGLAIAGVLACHFSFLIADGGQSRIVFYIRHIAFTGWLGVDVFFVLSGFLITEIILKDRSRPNFWGYFYLRRSFRILPVFIAFFVATLLVLHFVTPGVQLSAGYLISILFFMANWTIASPGGTLMLQHLWSLAVEEQFYFLWPQAAKRLSIPTIFKFALSLAAACEVLRIALGLLHVDGLIVYAITPTRIDGLSIGAAVAAGLKLTGVRRFLDRWWRRIALASAALLSISFVVTRGNLGPISVTISAFVIPPAVILTAMLIYGAVESTLPPSISIFFGNSVMTYLGRRSYALYLINQLIWVSVKNSRTDGYLANLPQSVAMNVLLMIAAIAVSVILTELSWRLVESPAQKLRNSLVNGMRVKTNGVVLIGVR